MKVSDTTFRRKNDTTVSYFPMILKTKHFLTKKRLATPKIARDTVANFSFLIFFFLSSIDKKL